MAAWDTTPKEYTDDEIRLLYVIDPYGVADYVKRRAEVSSELKDRLQYKDEKFELLYGRKPKYFARTLDDVWFEQDNIDELSTVVSESETLFGMHPIYDWVTLKDIITFGFDILCSGLGLIFGDAVGDAADMIVGIVITALEVVLSDEQRAKEVLSSYIADFGTDEAFKELSITWANDLVSLYDSLSGIIEDILVKPEFYSDVLNFCAYGTKYLVYLELENGEKCEVEDICASIDN